MRLHVCLFALLLASGAEAQTPPPRDTTRPSEAAATLRGRVTDAESGLALPEATVMVVLRSAVLTVGGGRGHQARTDAEGRFEVRGISPGAYLVVASPPDQTATHLPRAYGAALPYLVGTPGIGGGIELQAGDIRDGIDLALLRARAIEGRVVNDFGEPLANVSVTILAVSGTRMGAGAVTDDRGVFRAFGLAPGSYRVCATPEERGGMTEVADTTARLVRTCHPAATVEAAGDIVAVRESDVAGLVIQLQRTGTLTISGRVVDASGRLLTDAHVTVARRHPFTSGSVAVETTSGSFTARGVTPGDYVVRATANHSAGPDGPAARLQGFYPLRVEFTDVAGVEIRASEGATVTGRVVAEGATLPRGRLVVEMRRPLDLQNVFMAQPASAAVKDDRTFELRRLHGPQSVTLEGLPDGWVIQRVRYRGADVTDIPVEFASTSDPRDLEVAVTNRSARLSARIVDEGGRESVGQVLLLPADPARWQTGLAGREGIMAGGVKPGALRPGDYLVAAIPVEDLGGSMLDPSFAARVASVAQKVTLAAGEHRSLDVRLTPLPPAR